MRFFAGQIRRNIDGKGRICIPSNFRTILFKQSGSNILYLSPKCYHVEIYSEAELDRETEKLYEYSIFDTRASEDARKKFSSLFEVSFDKQGRMVISEEIRNRALLNDTNLIFVGCGRFFQIWEAEEWDHGTKSRVHAIGGTDEAVKN